MNNLLEKIEEVNEKQRGEVASFFADAETYTIFNGWSHLIRFILWFIKKQFVALFKKQKLARPLNMKEVCNNKNQSFIKCNRNEFHNVLFRVIKKRLHCDIRGNDDKISSNVTNKAQRVYKGKEVGLSKNEVNIRIHRDYPHNKKENRKILLQYLIPAGILAFSELIFVFVILIMFFNEDELLKYQIIGGTIFLVAEIALFIICRHRLEKNNMGRFMWLAYSARTDEMVLVIPNMGSEQKELLQDELSALHTLLNNSDSIRRDISRNNDYITRYNKDINDNEALLEQDSNKLVFSNKIRENNELEGLIAKLNASNEELLESINSINNDVEIVENSVLKVVLLAINSNYNKVVLDDTAGKAAVTKLSFSELVLLEQRIYEFEYSEMPMALAKEDNNGYYVDFRGKPGDIVRIDVKNSDGKVIIMNISRTGVLDEPSSSPNKIAQVLDQIQSDHEILFGEMQGLINEIDQQKEERHKKEAELKAVITELQNENAIKFDQLTEVDLRLKEAQSNVVRLTSEKGKLEGELSKLDQSDKSKGDKIRVYEAEIRSITAELQKARDEAAELKKKADTLKKEFNDNLEKVNSELAKANEYAESQKKEYEKKIKQIETVYNAKAGENKERKQELTMLLNMYDGLLKAFRNIKHNQSRTLSKLEKELQETRKKISKADSISEKLKDDYKTAKQKLEDEQRELENIRKEKQKLIAETENTKKNYESMKKLQLEWYLKLKGCKENDNPDWYADTEEFNRKMRSLIVDIEDIIKRRTPGIYDASLQKFKREFPKFENMPDITSQFATADHLYSVLINCVPIDFSPIVVGFGTAFENLLWKFIHNNYRAFKVAIDEQNRLGYNAETLGKAYYVMKDNSIMAGYSESLYNLFKWRNAAAHKYPCGREKAVGMNELVWGKESLLRYVHEQW